METWRVYSVNNEEKEKNSGSAITTKTKGNTGITIWCKLLSGQDRVLEDCETVARKRRH